MNRAAALFTAFLMAILAAPFAIAQDNTVRITEGTFEPMPIAVPAFGAKEGNVNPADAGAPSRQASLDIGRKIADVIQSDLSGSGLFRMVDQAAHIQKDLDIYVLPRFQDWKVIQADALVVGNTVVDSRGHMATQFRLYDVHTGRELTSQEYTVPSTDSWRVLAHIIADDIYEELTADRPYFDSRIVYIAESGNRSRRTRRLAVMDQDGANQEYLTDGQVEVSSPRFDPSSQTIIYNALVPDRRNPRIERRRVYLFDTKSGRQEVLGEFGSSSFAARFSPDGQEVAMSFAENGNSDIYIFDLARREPRRLTNDPAIDTSPSYSPDGKRIVFTSDRGGSQQLYVMNVDGSDMDCPAGGRAKVCRITFSEGRHSTPVWSPRGDLIAFTRQVDGQFEIGVIKPDGTGERSLFRDYHAEGPTWSPNGRVIMFFKETRGGWPALWSVDLTGRNLKRVQTQGHASDPAWSPVLH